MKASLKQKWIDALRSGKYKQTDKAFRDCNGFCAMGVLYDVDDPSGWYAVSGRVEKNQYNIKSSSYYGYDYTHYNEITTMNDLGKSFEEIADYIEKNVDITIQGEF